MHPEPQTGCSTPPSPRGGTHLASEQHWQCISGCGACCRLDPALRQDAIDTLQPEQQQRYRELVGADGWCVHFDTGRRNCRIYEDRPDFCQVTNLLQLHGVGPLGSPQADSFAIACCQQQIRAEYGGRGKVMKRFMTATRAQR